MEYVVRCPGSCGELVQGQINDQPFLVTCPINRFSYVVAKNKVIDSWDYLPQKSKLALTKLLAKYNDISKLLFYLESELSVGKGLASSSADIAALCYAANLIYGYGELDLYELAQLALSIEPSDATFFRGIVQFDYLHGNLIKPLGHIYGAKICLFDSKESIDSLEFNRRTDLVALRRTVESDIKLAMSRLTDGMINNDLHEIGLASTISAYTNQNILYKEYLDAITNISRTSNSYGVVIAHSGTVYGIMTEDDCIDEIKTKVKECAGSNLTYIDTVEIYNNGIEYKQRESV